MAAIQALVPLAELRPDDALSLAKARLLRLKPFWGHLFAGTRHRLATSLQSGLATTMDEYGRFEILHNPALWVMPDTPVKANGERMRMSELSEAERTVVEKSHGFPGLWSSWPLASSTRESTWPTSTTSVETVSTTPCSASAQTSPSTKA